MGVSRWMWFGPIVLVVGLTGIPDPLPAGAQNTTRALDGQNAFRGRVEPKSRVSSTFRGTVTVLDSAYALLEAELRPTTSLSTSRVLKEVDIAFEQQFSNYGGDCWLPVDFRARRDLDVQLSVLISFSGVRGRKRDDRLQSVSHPSRLS